MSAPEEMTLKVIAHIRTAFPTKFGIPRQSGLVDSLRGEVIFTPEYRNADAVRGLEDFSHIWLVWQFSGSVRDSWSPTVRPPRLGGNTRMGVFATRSPFRPNPLGLSSVQLEAIEHRPDVGPVLIVRGADLMDGTPIYDIKPYIPYADCHPDAAAGFTAQTQFHHLTVDETRVAEALSKRILVTIDKKTGVTTLEVTMQDPLISASLTDTVMHCLQNYITDYRTNKARHDLAFTEKLYKEAKADYEEAQKKYATFADANQNIILLSYRAEQERLKNEMELAYTVYTQVSGQLQMARAKVQEITPVYTVVQPATVPLRAAKPNKIMILIGFVFLAGVGCVGWILFVKDLFKEWRKASKAI